MTIDQERTYIMQHPKYKNSVKWKDRVMRMPEPQVHAIYKQFQKADYNKIARELKAQNKENVKYHQIDMFEYMENGKMERKEEMYKKLVKTMHIDESEIEECKYVTSVKGTSGKVLADNFEGLFVTFKNNSDCTIIFVPEQKGENNGVHED